MLAFLKQLPLTFYSAPFYAGLVKTGKGIGLGFIFVAALLALTRSTVDFAKPFLAFWDEKEALFESMPDVLIKNGELSIGSPSPKEIPILSGLEEGPFKILFDTSLDSSDTNRLLQKMDEEKIVALVTKEKIILRGDKTVPPDVKDVKTLKDVEIKREDWERAARVASRYFFPVLFVATGLLIFLNQLLFAFIGALPLRLAGYFFKVPASLASAMRLSAAARIPGAVLLLLVPPHPLFLLALWIGFAAFGLLAAKKAA